MAKFKHFNEIKTSAEEEATFLLYCGSCRFKKPDVEVRHSFGVYAGRFCKECAIKNFRDGCGLVDGKQGDISDLEEPYYEEEF